MTFGKTFAALLLGAVSSVAISTASFAADAVSSEAPVASGFNWSGVYVGFGVGAGAALHGFDLPGGFVLDGMGGDGIFGEVSVGYDRMVTERLLVGVLADARFGNLGRVPGMQIEGKYGFDAGLRLGYLVTPETLGYVSGGYSWQKFEISSSSPALDWNSSGYFVGAGLETVLSGNWTLKSEYRYSDYGTADPFGGFPKLNTSTHTFLAGANYRFGAQNGAASSFEAPAHNWTGFYLGGAIGAGNMVSNVPSFFALSGEGVSGGISAGYDYEFGKRWVVGVLADARVSGISAETGSIVALKPDYGFDVLARVGAKLSDATLAYAVAGYSWQHFKLDIPAGPTDAPDGGSSGFTVGAGLETALTDKTALNLEYRYSKYGDKDFGVGSIRLEPAFHTVRVGAKYKFN